VGEGQLQCRRHLKQGEGGHLDDEIMNAEQGIMNVEVKAARPGIEAGLHYSEFLVRYSIFKTICSEAPSQQ
jgi:hypothetical protein